MYYTHVHAFHACVNGKNGTERYDAILYINRFCYLFKVMFMKNQIQNVIVYR